MLGPALGPTLGGYIVDHWHWSWIFFINVPIGLLGLFMVGAFVEEDEEIRLANQELAERQRKNMDWAGIVLLTVGLTATEYFLEEGASNDWFQSRLIATCFAVGFGSLIAFVVRELTAPAPVVNLRLFKDPVFASGTLIGGVMFAMLMASMFLLPIFMQELLGFTATQSGIALMPRMLVMMLCMPIVGRIYNHVSPRIMIAFGISLIALGSWQMGELTLQSDSHDIIAAIAVQGVGFACLFVPLTTVALSKIPRHLMADATGLNSLIRQVGGAVGLAIFATLLGTYTSDARAGLAAHLNPENPLVATQFSAMQHGLMRHGADWQHAYEGALRMLNGRVMGQSMVLAFDKLFVLSGVLFLGVLPLLFFLKGGPRGKASAPALEH
jgi:DHA2 family multidrug resistance protein